ATTWQARRAEREARKADAVKEFLKTLFSAADPALAQGREPSVRQLLDAGARRIETDLRDQPDVQSEVARVIAGVYQSLSEYDRIPPLLAADLDRRRRGAAARVAGALRRYERPRFGRGDGRPGKSCHHRRAERQICRRRRPAAAGHNLADDPLRRRSSRYAHFALQLRRRAAPRRS